MKSNRRVSKKEEVKSQCLDSGFHSGTIVGGAHHTTDNKKVCAEVDSGLGIEYESPVSSTYSDLSVSAIEEDEKQPQKQTVVGANCGDSGLDLSLSERFSHEVNVSESTQENRVQLALKNAELLSEELDRILSPTHRQAIVNQAFAPDNDGDTRLHLAVIEGRLDLVFSLIYLALHPYYLDMQNNLSQTAIHLAVLTGQPNVVRPLVLAGANLLLRDRQGDTALHIACRRGDLECVKALTRDVTPLEHHYLRVTTHSSQRRKPPNLHPSLIMDTHNYQGRSCVHLAVINQHTNVVSWLKKLGANVNAKEGCGGRTPLTFAVESRDPQMVDFLVEECSVNMDAENYAGLTAYQIAYQSDRKMAEHLRSLGAVAFYDDDDDGQDSESDDEQSMDISCSSTQQPSPPPPPPPTNDEGAKRHFYDLKINGEPLWDH